MKRNFANRTDSPAKGALAKKRRGRPTLGNYAERTAAKSRLLVARDLVPVTDFLSYRAYLLKLYEILKDESPSYSYAQLSEDLGFSRSNVLWLVITGRRRLTSKATDRLIKTLGLAGNDKRYLEVLCAYINTRRADDREKHLRELMAIKGKAVANEASVHALEYFSEWHHPIIRELVGLDDFRSDPEWINQRLVTRLMPMQIHRSMELLERLGLIAYDRKRGRHVLTGGQVHPDRDVERMASVRFHQKMCDMAREAVLRVPAERREMNTMTLRVSDDIAMQAATLLYKACEQIMKLETEAKEGDQIYQINVHLFPFTKNPEA